MQRLLWTGMGQSPGLSFIPSPILIGCKILLYMDFGLIILHNNNNNPCDHSIYSACIFFLMNGTRDMSHIFCDLRQLNKLLVNFTCSAVQLFTFYIISLVTTPPTLPALPAPWMVHVTCAVLCTNLTIICMLGQLNKCYKH